MPPPLAGFQVTINGRIWVTAEGRAIPVVDSNFRALLRARYTANGGTMATESLSEIVRSLTPQEQDAVRLFIDYLKQREASVRSQSPFLQAADEFIAQHPELLQRLAQ